MNLFKVSISLFFATAIAACSSVDTGSTTREISCFDTGDGVICVEGLPGDGADADGDGTADSLLCEDVSNLSGDESSGSSADDGDDGDDGDEEQDAVGDDDSTSDQDGDGTTDSQDSDDDGDGVNDSQDSDDDGDGVSDDDDCDNVDPNGDLPPVGDIPQ